MHASKQANEQTKRITKQKKWGKLKKKKKEKKEKEK